MTEAEKRIWMFLREQKDTWLRQKLINNYIVDFYCSKYQLVVEVDGETHGTKEEMEYDKRRTDFLESLSLRVIRFTNIEVYESYE